MDTPDLEKQALGSGLITPTLQPPNSPPQSPSPPHRIPRRFRLALRQIVFTVFLFCLGGIGWNWYAGETILKVDGLEWAWLPLSSAPPLPRLVSWGQNLSSSDFTSGLSPFPSHSPPVASGADPVDPDSVYNLHPITYPAYTAAIDEFVSVVLPPRLQLEYQTEKEMDGMVGSVHGWDAVDERRVVWQTDKDEERVDGTDVRSWREGSALSEGWEWKLMLDDTATTWIKQHLAGTRLEKLWANLPSGILNADLIRYLLLALRGGIYSDTDTLLLKPPSRWGAGADLWRGGKGWMSEADIARMELLSGASEEERDREMDRLLGRARVVVGIEADVGEREDWAEWWPRPLQIVQWTMAMAPYHPIALSAVLRVLHNTATAVTFAQDHYSNYTSLRTQLSSLPVYPPSDLRTELEAQLAHFGKINVLTEPRNGGPLGVINWTGPSVFTDAVLSYLLARYGITWRDLRGLQRPLRVGDVLVLPVTGFSPGVGNFGAGDIWSAEAMVEHHFRGSWKG